MRLGKTLFATGAVLAISLLAAACRSQTPTTAPEPTVSQTAALPASVTPSETPTKTSTPTPSATETASPTPTPQISGPDNFPAFVNPLTGLAVEDLSLLERNPVIVKVANFPRGLRPHSGLSWADLVYEYYIGAGATRFSAVYYGQNPPEAGPVRSGRLIDAQLGSMYNALLAFASADAFVYERILNALGDRAISEGPNSCPALCRIGNGDVNSVRAYPELLTEFAADQRGIVPVRPNLDGTSFDPIAPEGGSAGLKATIQYSISTISEWRYDSDTSLYTRYIEEVDANGVVELIPLVDALTDEQLTASNVVVLFVETIELKPTLHDFNLANNFTGQRGLVFRDGQVYDIVWKSQGGTLPPQFFDLDGNLLPLQPGNTWFHIVGISSSSSESAPGEWTITNFIP